jgi:hypothetical protein
VHPGRPRVPAAPPYIRTTAAPAGSPETLTAPGEEPLPSHAVRRRSKRKGRREWGEEPPAGKSFAAKPEPPEGGAGPAVNAYILCFPFLLDVAPPPSSSSSSPPSRTTTLHRRLRYGPWPPR